MRLLASQLKRWYQIYSPSRSFPLQPVPAVQQCRHIRRARDRGPPPLEDIEEGSKLRVFEQDGIGIGERVELDPNEEDYGEENRVYAELKKLNAEIKTMVADGPFGPSSKYAQSLSEEQRAEYLPKWKELQESSKRDEENTIDTTARGAQHEELASDRIRRDKLVDELYKVKLQVPLTHQIYVRKFNEALQKATKDKESPSDARKDLWMWYNRAKQNVPYFLTSIPEPAWLVLWTFVSESAPANSDRSTHLKVLAEDRLSAGLALDPSQHLTYIECLDIDGERDRAVQKWEAFSLDSEEDNQTVTDYLSLGLRLYSEQGELTKARELALKLSTRQGLEDFRSLKSIIRAFSETKGPTGGKEAWASYLTLRAGLGKNTTMEDYDEISIMFLETGRPELGLAVFKDMMLSGEKSKYNSEALYQAARGFVGKLHARSVNPENLNRLSLSTLLTLPRRFENKFFYGSWIKKLIGMGQLDAAAMVVELMFERGVVPDARYLNGLISAWFRLGDSGAKSKAEGLGWAMIRKRIDLVSSRNVVASEAKPVVESPPDADIPPFLQREIPQATVETFSILTQYYARRSKDNIVGYLQWCLTMAQIPPNSYIMNHLLYAEFRKKDLHAVMDLFRKMTQTARPDLETFAVLWDCSKLNYNKIHSSANDTTFPSCRNLYGYMLEWYSGLSPYQRDRTTQQFSRELYDQVIQCFCLSRDLQGTVVALRSLKNLFNIFPDQKTASFICLRLSRLLPVDYSKITVPRHRLRRLSGNPAHKANLATVTKVLEAVYDARDKEFAEEGTTLEERSQEVRDEAALRTLTDLIMISLRQIVSAKDVDGSLKRRFEEAGKGMGCRTDWLEEALESSRVMKERIGV